MSRISSKSAVKSAAAGVVGKQAPVEVKSAPIVKSAPDKSAPVVTLSNALAPVQAQGIIDALKAPHVRVAAAALAECEGKLDNAAQLVGAGVVATIHLIGRIIPILRNSAPAELFTDGNNRGAKVGELFASKLGLSALYRDVTRADLKSARAALVDSAR